MIYIYNDYGGTHTSSLAAAYHLNILPASTDQLSKEQILSVPFFNQLKKSEAGKLIFHGKDQDGNRVYTIGRRSSKLVVPALEDLSKIFLEMFESEERVIFSNTSPTVPFAMTIGGGLARGLGLNTLGVPLLVMGAKKCCGLVFELVENTKKLAASENGKNVLIIDNKQFKV